MDPVVLRLLLVLALVGSVALAGRWWRSRDGRVRDGVGVFTIDQLRRVGLDVSRPGTVAVLLGSPTCAPCVTVKRVLSELAEERADFRWVYVDAADHLDLADAHHVMRVPTLFVLDRRGRILARTSGVPTLADLVAVLDREGDLEAAA